MVLKVVRDLHHQQSFIGFDKVGRSGFQKHRLRMGLMVLGFTVAVPFAAKD